jgi:signal transduction histidine kinase
LSCAVIVILLSHTVLAGIADSGSFLLVLLLALFAAGRYGAKPFRVLAALIAAVVIPLAAFDPAQPPTIGDWIFFSLFIGTTFVGGVLFRARHERDLRMAGRAERAERDGESRAREAVASERARIARELHDIVAHAIGVIVVQARAGRRAIIPAEATDAFDAIERSGEQALAEMRRLLTLLRYDDTGLAPQPGVGQLDQLAAQVSAAGLPVHVLRNGNPVTLSPGLDLSAYRIVQEALTNALKHAGPARARVVLSYHSDDVEIEVTDDGEGSGTGGGSGRGLAGIRERVSIYGGEMVAEPGAEGGYVVRARLPLVAPA